MRISIRYQILALIGSILVGAMSIYLYEATSLFARDKLASLYDFDSMLASTLSEELRADLRGMVDKLLYFGRLESVDKADPPSAKDRRAKELFASDENVLAVEIWQQAKPATFQRTYRYIDPDRLAALNLTEADLNQSLNAYPVPLAQVAAEKIYVGNASLAPDIGLLRVGAATPDGSLVVVADLRPDRFLQLFGRSDLYQAYVVDARGDVLVHPDPKKLLEHANFAASPVVQDALDGKVARGTREFEAGHEALLGSFARIDPGRFVVIVQAPKSQALAASRDLTRKSVMFGALVMFVALGLSIYFSRRLAAPLRGFEETMVKLSRGEFGVQVPVQSRNEIGNLAEAFNRMSRELSDRETRLMEANAQLVQSEKLSALGEMSAGLVHEVKNPMVGIIGFAQLGQFNTDPEELQEYFRLIEADANRANEILQNLLEFARPPKVDVEELEVTQVVEGAIRLVAHLLQMMRVKLEVRLAEGLPRFRGNSNQLRQVLLNLFMNAAHAMEATPEKRLTVSTSATADGGVLIEVRDTGEGIPLEIQKKLFQPFFTTKPRGKGTGLGLSVSHSIVAQHGGEIRVESEPGKGTAFLIRLPGLRPRPEEPPQVDGTRPVAV